MAGKIVADTLEHSTAGSVDTQYVVNGSAKAWSTFNASGGTPTNLDNLNVSSLTDTATGQTTLNFTKSPTAIGLENSPFFNEQCSIFDSLWSGKFNNTRASKSKKLSNNWKASRLYSCFGSFCA